MASLTVLCFLSAQGTHTRILHLLRPPDKHATTLPFRFLPKPVGCSGLCRGEGFHVTAYAERRVIAGFDRHHAIRYTVIRGEGYSTQAERVSTPL